MGFTRSHRFKNRLPDVGDKKTRIQNKYNKQQMTPDNALGTTQLSRNLNIIFRAPFCKDKWHVNAGSLNEDLINILQPLSLQTTRQLFRTIRNNR